MKTHYTFEDKDIKIGEKFSFYNRAKPTVIHPCVIIQDETQRSAFLGVVGPFCVDDLRPVLIKLGTRAEIAKWMNENTNYSFGPCDQPFTV